jgi:O-antigen/teichoic acid export membrane protein
MATLTQTLPPQSTSGHGPRRTLVNTASIFGGEALSRLATSIMALIVARRFGAEALGQYGYALSLASVLVLVPDFGLHLLTTRNLAAQPELLGRTFWSLHWLKLPLVAAVVLFAVGLGEWTVGDEGRRIFLYVLVARSVFQTFSQAYIAVFRAFEQMQYVALVQFTNAFVVIACAGVALGLQFGAPLVVASFVVGQAAETWLAWRVLERQFSPGPCAGWDSRFLRRMMVAAVPIGVTALLQALNIRLDVLILGIFAPNAELGRFQAAAWFVVGTFLGASLLMAVLFPRLSRLLQTPSKRGSAYVESLLKHAFLFTTLGSLVVWVAAPLLLHWTFGRSLAPAADLLRILAPALPFVFFNTVLFYVFVAARRRSAYLGTLALGLVLGATSGFLLAARLGAKGSAIADLVREVAMTASFLYFLYRDGLAPAAGKTLLTVLAGASALCLPLVGWAGISGRWESWPVAWNLLVLAGSLFLLGLPRQGELLLLVDEDA